LSLVSASMSAKMVSGPRDAEKAAALMGSLSTVGKPGSEKTTTLACRDESEKIERKRARQSERIRIFQ